MYENLRHFNHRRFHYDLERIWRAGQRKVHHNRHSDRHNRMDDHSFSERQGRQG